ncbi:hypothetical protein [Paractinoplanes durhamensis]|uniref:Phosphodiesterase n=1 Tax=Paractinoplanes durhamensis TaxID=113563 RepID=A0ABQ3YW81_9ACTN|nr:hypothetical protein [Actinoplanes durhamensis]GIE01808.1 hypothetical protein Adu01nite_31580 [Actinoplanes durhamensis]
MWSEDLTPEQISEWHQRTSAPDNELPAAAGLSAVLGRTEDTAVGLSGVEVFSGGFRFTLAVRLRRARPETSHGGLLALVGSHHPHHSPALEDRLLLGIEYADGSRASTLHDTRRDGPSEDPGLMIVSTSGGGGDLTVDQEYWVSPLPPEGPVTVVLAWPSFGIPETRTVLDGAAIRAAAERSQLLWPPQPPEEPTMPEPSPRPATGWFADPPGTK